MTMTCDDYRGQRAKTTRRWNMMAVRYKALLRTSYNKLVDPKEASEG